MFLLSIPIDRLDLKDYTIGVRNKRLPHRKAGSPRLARKREPADLQEV